jgi:hypothetical protein
MPYICIGNGSKHQEGKFQIVPTCGRVGDIGCLAVPQLRLKARSDAWRVTR